jgi:hypothetical protein
MDSYGFTGSAPVSVKGHVSVYPRLLKEEWRRGSFIDIIIFLFIWFVKLLALRPLLAYCASLVG